MSSQWLLGDDEYRQLPRKEPAGLRWTLGDEEAGRRRLCGRVHALGVRLGLPQAATATAMVYVHRFLVRQPINGAPGALVPAAVFLAGKVEEHPRRLRDIVPAWADVQREAPVPGADAEAILSVERVLLRILCFDLAVEHPYGHVLQAAQALAASSGADCAGLGADDVDELVQTAWTIVNDSFRTALCVRAEARDISAGALVLAAERLALRPVLARYAAGDACLFSVPRERVERVLLVLRRVYSEHP